MSKYVKNTILPTKNVYICKKLYIVVNACIHTYTYEGICKYLSKFVESWLIPGYGNIGGGWGRIRSIIAPGKALTYGGRFTLKTLSFVTGFFGTHQSPHGTPRTTSIFSPTVLHLKILSIKFNPSLTSQFYSFLAKLH